MNDLIHEVDRMSAEEPTDWTCKECGETFQTERAFNLHYQNEHGEHPKKPV